MAKFKVGDRVRITNAEGFAGGTPVGAMGTVTSAKGAGILFDLEHPSKGVIRQVTFVGDGDIEPAPLTIEAGRYYKTRDGRKVGPMAEFICGRYHETPGDGRWWSAKGVGHMYADGDDLIAEWVEPEAAEVQDTVPVAIIAVIENGRPKPANYPIVHPTRDAAVAEAKRLSTRHLGKEFGVFELVTTCKEKRQFDHEWQRLAVNGEKISAIKEIRRLTGFGLKSSKDGLEDWLSRNAA